VIGTARNLRRGWVAALAVLAAACATPQPNRDPVGERFPPVEGTALDGERVGIPEAFAGRRVLLLVGTVMEAQFDIDRWILGLMQAEVPVEIREVPTIEGILPALASPWIDGGMRSGIPEEDWPAVVTVYGDAGAIVRFLGNERPRNARVILLDESGTVIWFHDRGYAPRLVLEIDAICRS